MHVSVTRMLLSTLICLLTNSGTHLSITHAHVHTPAGTTNAQVITYAQMHSSHIYASTHSLKSLLRHVRTQVLTYTPTHIAVSQDIHDAAGKGVGVGIQGGSIFP